MSPRNKGVPHSNRAEHESRDQEVLRANRELAAYFKGQRTEREARAALKIIKAFLRDRERTDPAARRPLPGTQPLKVTHGGKPKKAASPKMARRKPKRQIPREMSAAGDERDVESTTPVPADTIDD